MTNPKSIKERIEKVLSREGVRGFFVYVAPNALNIIRAKKEQTEVFTGWEEVPVIDAAYVTKLESFIRDVVPELVEALDYEKHLKNLDKPTESYRKSAAN